MSTPQHYQVKYNLPHEAFSDVWDWFCANGYEHPNFRGEDFITLWVAQGKKGSLYRSARLYRNKFYWDAQTGRPYPPELKIYLNNLEDLDAITASILGPHTPLGDPEIETVTPKSRGLSAQESRFLGEVCPNRLSPIFHDGKSWSTLKGTINNRWIRAHFDRDTIRIGSMQGVAVGSGRHPGGFWDDSESRWHGGLRVRFASVDFDCAKGDEHVSRAIRLRDYLARIGMQSLIITSSDVLKSGATFPGIRVLIRLDPMWYSEFRASFEHLLHRAGFSMRKGECELSPDSSRGSRIPFGRGSDVYESIDLWGGSELRRTTATAQEGIARFFELEPVQLQAAASRVGFELDKYARAPWLRAVEDKRNLVDPLLARTRNADIEGAGELDISSALFSIGLPAENTRFAAMGYIIGALRKAGNSKEHTQLKAYNWLCMHHNGHSTFINDLGFQAAKKWVYSAVESLWKKPFCSSATTAITGRRLKPVQLGDAETRFLESEIKDSDLRRFVRGIWEGVGEILDQDVQELHVASTLLSRAARKQSYLPYLEELARLGWMEALGGYQTSTQTRAGFCRSYRIHFRELFYAWCKRAVDLAREKSKDPFPLLSQCAADKNNICPGVGGEIPVSIPPGSTAATDCGDTSGVMDDFIGAWGAHMLRRMKNENIPNQRLRLVREPTPEFDYTFGGAFSPGKEKKVEDKPKEKPKADIRPDFAAWGERLRQSEAVRRNTERDQGVEIVSETVFHNGKVIPLHNSVMSTSRPISEAEKDSNRGNVNFLHDFDT